MEAALTACALIGPVTNWFSEGKLVPVPDTGAPKA